MTDYDWVCGEDRIPPFTQAMFFLGGAVGNLAFGAIADHFGRYPTFVAANIIVMVSGIVTPYCADVYSFTAIRFVMGLTHSTYFGTIYLLALEYVFVTKRSIIGNVSMAVGLTVGGCVEPWILRALGDWKLLMPVLFAQGGNSIASFSAQKMARKTARKSNLLPAYE